MRKLIACVTALTILATWVAPAIAGQSDRLAKWWSDKIIPELQDPIIDACLIPTAMTFQEDRKARQSAGECLGGILETDCSGSASSELCAKMADDFAAMLAQNRTLSLMGAGCICKKLSDDCRDHPGADSCTQTIRRFAVAPGGEKPSTLYNAAYAGRTELVRSMLQLEFDPNLPESGPGWTPLMIAAAEGHAKTVTVLLNGGANPDATNPKGRTALMFASSKGHSAIVRDLLEHGANPNVVPDDESRWTALIAAAYNGHREVVELLLGSGADKTLKDRKGKTAFGRAKSRGHKDIARLLKD